MGLHWNYIKATISTGSYIWWWRFVHGEHHTAQFTSSFGQKIKLRMKNGKKSRQNWFHTVTASIDKKKYVCVVQLCVCVCVMFSAFIYVNSVGINLYIYFLILFFSNFSSDSVLRNDSTRLIQPEVIFRTDGNGQAPGINSIGNGAPMDRKGAVAIGQSVFYTENPPQDYGVSGKQIIYYSFPYIFQFGSTESFGCHSVSVIILIKSIKLLHILFVFIFYCQFKGSSPRTLLSFGHLLSMGLLLKHFVAS